MGNLAEVKGSLAFFGEYEEQSSNVLRGQKRPNFGFWGESRSLTSHGLLVYGLTL